jgi:hypothetical protein
VVADAQLRLALHASRPITRRGARAPTAPFRRTSACPGASPAETFPQSPCPEQRCASVLRAAWRWMRTCNSMATSSDGVRPSSQCTATTATPAPLPAMSRWFKTSCAPSQLVRPRCVLCRPVPQKTAHAMHRQQTACPTRGTAPHKHAQQNSASKASRQARTIHKLSHPSQGATSAREVL